MKKIVYISTLLLVSFSCAKDKETNDTNNNPGGNMLEVNFPNDFNFSAIQDLKINIPDQNGVVYKIYGKYGNERELLSTGSVTGSNFSKEFPISSHYTEVELERWASGGYRSRNYMVNPNGTVINQFFKGKKKAQSSSTDILYGINSGGDFFTIDLSDFSSTMLSSPLQGSIALAVDTISDKVYYHKHPNMYAYDINTATHSLFATYSTPFNGNYPRMEYNHNDGYLYVAKNSTLHVIDPVNGNTIKSYNITGIVNSNTGGDLAFPPNGKIYMSCFSGLYSLTFSGNTAQAIRLSAENFPFQLTSLGYDSNNFLYAGTTDGNSKLIKIDPVDGSWIIVQTFNHAINDLGSVVRLESSLPQIDSDGDGVIDELDAAPNDSAIAHEEFTPSQLGFGTLGFEDLWPAQGDYDFNDLVVGYRFIKYLNTKNKMAKLEAKFLVKAIGASYHNGFGIELDIDPSLIESVTGAQLTKNLITVNSKGLEEGHSGKSVIVVFDDAFDQIPFPGGGYFINTEPGSPSSDADTITITVNFQQLVESDAAGEAPFNPFIFINGDRSKEVHLADHEPTVKHNGSLMGTVDDNSDPGSGKYYRSENNLPWAINVSHQFRYPIEKKRVDQAYNYFVSWALSSGNGYTDWYKDNSGYRNTSNIYMK